MQSDSQSRAELRVLVLAPTGADARIASSVMRDAGFASEVCADIAQLCDAMAEGAGAILIASEALHEAQVPQLIDCLSRQPAWSDISLILLTLHDAIEPSFRLIGAFGEHVNVVLLERPCQAATLVSAIRTALRSRRRQYEVREFLRREQAARTEIERNVRAKDEFLATLSHELRTPLNAIVGWSQVLRLRSRDDDELRNGLEVIDRNARVQARLIDDLLDMSRIVSGKVRLELERADVRPLAHASVESVRHAADVKGVELREALDGPVLAVLADPARLQQCFVNLLGNAVKFTPRGGRVDAQLECRPDHVEFSVTDDGEGIAAEFLPHVFERFRQADASATRRYGGLGLGLSIVRSLVELHGGSVHAASEGPGRGARFAIRLPLASDPALGRGWRGDANAVSPKSLVGLKVLAIDDDSDARELVKRILEECGAQVVLAASAREGLEMLRLERPDILLSDIGMADADGYQLIREVRRLPEVEGGRIPAAALSAFTASEDRTRSLRAGYQVHLGKPIDCTELATTVAVLAAGRG